MAGEPEFMPLASLVDAGRGISYGVVQPGHHIDAGIPIVRVTDIRNGRIDHTDPLRVAPEIAAKYRRTELKGGELLLTLVGTVGETAVVPNTLCGWNTARAVAVIPVREDPGPHWVRYALQTGGAREYINGRLNTTVQATLNLGDVAALPVPMPNRTIRERILGILRTLDDKIELNRKMNETLEQMARALFKSWFVDFDPVRAKAAGRKPFGMDDATAALFPDGFEDSELGEIPRGWRASKLGEILELKRGYDLPSARRSPGSVPVVSSSGPSGVHNEHKVAGSGIVTGRYGTIGRVFLIRESFWPLNTTLYVRDLKETQLYYAYHLLSGLDFQKFSDKAAVPGINRNHVHEEPVVAPPDQLQIRFAQIVSTWDDLHARFQDESNTLTRLRDELLPRLLSGALTVAKAQRQVEDVA
jgi:type I restriction enzyme, S subunit